MLNFRTIIDNTRKNLVWKLSKPTDECECYRASFPDLHTSWKSGEFGNFPSHVCTSVNDQLFKNSNILSNILQLSEHIFLFNLLFCGWTKPWNRHLFCLKEISGRKIGHFPHSFSYLLQYQFYHLHSFASQSRNL